MQGGTKSPTDFTPEQIAANRAEFERRKSLGEIPDRQVRLLRGKNGLPPCADMEDELLGWEIAKRNLDLRKRWFRCRTTHGQHACCGKKEK